MAYSYNIWNSVNSCLYKGKQSYGVKDHSEIDMFVGYGSSNSTLMTTIKQTRKRIGDWDSFRLYIDNKVVKAMYYNYKTKKFTRRMPSCIKAEI
tara:strand:+ start:321 stop:602 length:282 start_codon:yes stop_codon:yes gene_type:complete